MSWEFERVAGPYGFTEGPVWDGEGVLFSDIPNSRVMRYDAATGETAVYREGTNAANGLKLGPGGALYACEMSGRRVARYTEAGTETVVEEYEGGRYNSPNDLAFDSAGNLWFTDPFYDTGWLDAETHEFDLDHRSVYRVDTDDPETLTRMTHDTTNPNGLLVSPDDGTLYVAQSDYEGDLELRAYPIEDDGLGEYEVLHDFSPHRGIDGMCFDEDGNVVATAGYEQGGPGPMVYVFAPDGRVLETHPVDVPRPTNCAFGDDDLRTLYLTGSDGVLRRARTDRRGLLGAP
ncbi:gluconolactonase [Halobacteriales archaeon QS_5_70_15]|nr:MAG: gluconolactonase [Halobacteriales archaeon QS_5_70_15]